MGASFGWRNQPEAEMKDATTQDIVRNAPMTKQMGKSWQEVYYSLQKLMKDTTHNRIFRKGNSLLFYQITEPKIASGVVFSIDPPRTLGNAYIEFCKALKAAGFKQLITSTDQELVYKMLDKSGFDGDISKPNKNSQGKDEWDLFINLQGDK